MDLSVIASSRMPAHGVFGSRDQCFLSEMHSERKGLKHSIVLWPLACDTRAELVAMRLAGGELYCTKLTCALRLLCRYCVVRDGSILPISLLLSFLVFSKVSIARKSPPVSVNEHRFRERLKNNGKKTRITPSLSPR